MALIYAIGETVYDIIFRNGQPVAAKPGGSMLNSAVSLGRCGLEVEMITEIGDDAVGNLVNNFLEENGVSISFIHPVKELKTPVSLAFLDEKGNANYSFYKNYPSERLNIHWPDVKNGDIVLFGSFYSLGEGVRDKIVSFIQKAKQQGALIVYDPNIRKNHLEEIRRMMHLVEQNISLADITRGSDEDFWNLFGLDDDDKIAQRVKASGCQHLVITRGKHGADYLSGDVIIHIPAKEINVVSTIGAGDAFNAGIIFSLINKRITVDDLVNISREEWTEILGFGITFASDVCSGMDNYISFDLLKETR
jgi:fructokinase